MKNRLLIGKQDFCLFVLIADYDAEFLFWITVSDGSFGDFNFLV